MEIVLLLTGLAAGAVAGWLVARFKFAADGQVTASAVVVEQEKNKTLQGQVNEFRQLLQEERMKVLELTNNLATADANFRNLEEKLAEQKNEVNNLQDKFTVQFKNLANDIFEEKSKKFTEQNKTNLTDVLKPLGEKITEFEKRIDQTHRESIEKNAGLFNELKNLKELNVQMSEEARNLTRALRGDTKTQGAWGEFILESILEKSGLEKGREYLVQESFTTAEGRRQQPDVVLHLPDQKHIIIDSKVSLTAYDRYMNAETDEERVSFIKAHLQSIRQHMRILADKNYQKNYSTNGLDFVIMFIPLEPAYLLAIQHERNLYDEGFDKRIVFVSPTLLLPSLQMIKGIWKQEYQTRNVIEIATRAGDLYDKFVGFTNDLVDVGVKLEASKKSYEESMKKLTTGNGNLVSKVEYLKKLGAKAEKSINPKLLARAEDQADLFEQA